jgi:hypothetical protein
MGNVLVDQQLRIKIAAEFPSVESSLQVWQFPGASQYEEEDPWTAASGS